MLYYHYKKQRFRSDNVILFHHADTQKVTPFHPTRTDFLLEQNKAQPLVVQLARCNSNSIFLIMQLFYIFGHLCCLFLSIQEDFFPIDLRSGTSSLLIGRFRVSASRSLVVSLRLYQFVPILRVIHVLLRNYDPFFLRRRHLYLGSKVTV